MPVTAAAALSAPLDPSLMVAANEKVFGVSYSWSEESRELARRLSAKDRAADIVHRHPLTGLLLTAGHEDPMVGEEQLTETANALRDHGFPEAQVVTGVPSGEGHQVGPDVNGLLTGWMTQQLL